LPVLVNTLVDSRYHLQSCYLVVSHWRPSIECRTEWDRMPGCSSLFAWSGIWQPELKCWLPTVVGV